MVSRLLRILARLAYLGALVVVFAVSAYLSFNLFVRRGVVAVPELVGLTESEARAVLADQGLAFRLAAAGRHDDAVAAGLVLENRPRSGSRVKRGAQVELVLSRGPQLVRVPDLRGQTVAAAQVTLGADGLRVGRTLSVVSALAAPGTVAGQSPGADEPLGHGGEVDLLVAQETTPDSYVMPDLVHRSLEGVRRVFERRGFRLGSVTVEPYEGLPAGVILRQQPTAGHRLARRDAISVVVSGGTGGV